MRPQHLFRADGGVQCERWSSHLEFADARARRVRCDFVSRPPRAPRPALEQLFAPATTRAARHVVDIPTLIALKQTQRAKDYAVIAELAARLPPEQEIEVTTDPDRILALATGFGRQASRPAVRAARQAPVERRAVVVVLAEEIDALQQTDRRRVAAYETAAQRRTLTRLVIEPALCRESELARRQDSPW